jgi:tetratricopeptide (TPR) repeat protein
VRQYARDKLEEAGVSKEALDWHQSYYYQRVVGDASPLNAQEEILWQDFLKTEYDNIRAALDTALLHDHVEQAVEMCFVLSDLWEAHRWFGEAHESIERCLLHQEEIQDRRKRAHLLSIAGWFHQLRGGYEKATDFQQQSLSLARETEDREREANALNNLALIARAKGNSSEARSLFTESLEIVRSLGDARKQAARLSNLGLLENEDGDWEKSREHLEEARVIYARLDDTQGLAACLCNLADMALHQKDGEEAARLSHQCYDLFRRLEIPPGIAIALTNLAEAALLHSDPVQADNYSQEALTLCLDIEMQELIPHLLELRAESQVQQGQHSSALFCLTAANRLRECSASARLKSEQERVEAIEARLVTALGTEAGEELPQRIARLSLSAIVKEALQAASS